MFWEPEDMASNFKKKKMGVCVVIFVKKFVLCWKNVPSAFCLKYKKRFFLVRAKLSLDLRLISKGPVPQNRLCDHCETIHCVPKSFHLYGITEPGRQLSQTCQTLPELYSIPHCWADTAAFPWPVRFFPPVKVTTV